MARYTDFTAAKDGLVELSRKIVRARMAWDQARTNLGKAYGVMLDLNEPDPTGFMELLQLINDQAAANPNDPAWQDLKRERDKIVADGLDTRNSMSDKLTAFDDA